MKILRKREKVRGELERRFSEVKSFQKTPINSQELARDYFIRIAHYMNYVKADRNLQSSCKQLEDELAKLDIIKHLAVRGKKLKSKIQKDFGYIDDLLSKKKIKVQSLLEEFEPHTGVGSISPKRALTLTYHSVVTFLKSDRLSVWQIPEQLRNIQSIIGTIKEMGIENKKLNTIADDNVSKISSYEDMLTKQKTYISFLRLQDYHELNDIWNFYYNTQTKRLLSSYLFSSFSFHLGKVLDDSVTQPYLNDRELKILAKLKTKYFHHLQRFHNYLLDKLDSPDWWEETGIWLFESFGRTLVGLIIILIIFFILKLFGFTIPIDIIKGLLNL